MKFYLILIPVMLFLSACNGQSSSLKQANDVKDAIVAARPGTMPTSETGWMMKAYVDGKLWTATSIIPPRVAGRIVGCYKEAFISMPFDKQSMVVGKKIQISEDDVIDLALGSKPDFWSGKKGEMEITAVNGEWVEGSFHFTATDSNKPNKLEITNGFFRVSMK